MVARVPSGGCDGDSDGADGAGFELGPLLHRTRGRSSPGHSHDRQKGKSSATVTTVKKVSRLLRYLLWRFLYALAVAYWLFFCM